MTLELAVLAMLCIASRYRICIAGALDKISAACLINLADSTSVRETLAICKSACEESIRRRTCACTNDLRLTSTLALCGHGQAVLEFLTEDDVLDEHALNCNTPSCCGVFDDLPDRLRDLFTALDHILQHTRANDMSERSLRTLNESLSQVGDTESCLVWTRDVIVDDGSQSQIDIVLRHAHLLRHLDNLNLDVHLDQVLREWIDLYQAWVYSSCETTELGHEADVTLRDRLRAPSVYTRHCLSPGWSMYLVWIRANDAAWDRSKSTDAVTKIVDHGAIPAVLICILSVWLNDLRIGWLQILSTWSGGEENKRQQASP